MAGKNLVWIVHPRIWRFLEEIWSLYVKCLSVVMLKDFVLDVPWIKWFPSLIGYYMVVSLQENYIKLLIFWFILLETNPLSSSESSFEIMFEILSVGVLSKSEDSVLLSRIE